MEIMKFEPQEQKIWAINQIRKYNFMESKKKKKSTKKVRKSTVVNELTSIHIQKYEPVCTLSWVISMAVRVRATGSTT
jgi:hypothetical protein